VKLDKHRADEVNQPTNFTVLNVSVNFFSQIILNFFLDYYYQTLCMLHTA